jgi:hypothetical protein
MRVKKDITKVKSLPLNDDPRRMTLEDLADMNELLNRIEKETHPQTTNEVGDWDDYPDIRYDR